GSSSRPSIPMSGSLFDPTRTIAEAMLAGAPERAGVLSRMAAVLGGAPPWTHEVADAALARFGARWADVDI
ncbi:hypothetical protein NO135_25750, partial [Clostridioides difficile]|nr:hypothetical protein [Clostridioides difficile]